MANTLYATFKQQLESGAINLTTADIRVALVTSGYTPNFSTDQYLSTVTSGNIVARSATLTGVSVTGGVFNASSVTLSSVTGSAVSKLVVYIYNASDSAAQLILCDDTASSGLPVTPNGGNITINWDTGANKIFAL